MRRRTSIALCLLTLLVVASPLRADEREQPDGAKKTCVAVSTEARYANYGYDHVVTLRNGCDEAQRCEVKTDVAPELVTVDLGPNETKSLVTFRGSPAREFKADVSCKAAG